MSSFISASRLADLMACKSARVIGFICDTTVRIILAPYNREMRTAPLLIALFLLAGAAALAYFPIDTTVSQGPGAYPLGPRPQYSATIRTAPFQPAKSTGTDAVPPSSSLDAKTKCLTECPSLTPASSKLPFA